LNSVGLIVEPGSAMFVNGATSGSGPFCLMSSRKHNHVSLGSCLNAIASGRGDEIFMIADEGTVSSATEPEQCLMLSSGDTSDSRAIVKGSCSFAMNEGNGLGMVVPNAKGQLKLSKTGNYCVSVNGEVHAKNVASGADIRASSSQNGHAAENAIDGVDGHSTYWASAPEQSASATVDVTIDFGKTVHIETLQIDWELPAKSFELRLGVGGELKSFFATVSNSFNKTMVVAHGEYGRFLQVRMHEPHPVWAATGGGFAYAIKDIRVVASEAAVVASDCTEASESSDARDKFSVVLVPEFDPIPAASAADSGEFAIRAGDRLGGLLAQLLANMPALDSCGLMQKRKCITGNCSESDTRQPTELFTQAHGIRTNEYIKQSHSAHAIDAMGLQLGIDKHELNNLVDSTRAAVASIKSKLNN